MKTIQQIQIAILLALPLCSFSQDFWECDSLVLEITAVKNVNTWAKKEGYYDYIHESNRVVSFFSPAMEGFIVVSFQRMSCFQRTDYDSVIKHKDDSSSVKVYHPISRKLITELLAQMAIDKCCNYEFIGDSLYNSPGCCELEPTDFGIDEEWLRQNINRREILKQAKKRGVRWMFQNQYSMREDRLVAYKGYANLDSMLVFLKDFQRPPGLIFVSHTSQNLYLDLTCRGDTILSLFKIISPLGLNSAWIDNVTQSEIYNPQINLIVSQILPKGFLYKKIIRRDFIKEYYLNWILDRWEETP